MCACVGAFVECDGFRKRISKIQNNALGMNFICVHNGVKIKVLIALFVAPELFVYKACCNLAFVCCATIVK